MNSVGVTGLDSPRAEHIRRLVDAAPPLSETQRSRIAAALGPVASRVRRAVPRQRRVPADAA